MKNFYSATIATILGSLLLVTTGCGKANNGQPQVHPAVGQLQFEGQPLPGAFLVLHPKNPGPNALPARATSGADGSFKLTTFAAGDGAIAGEYAVTVEYWQSVPNGDESSRSANLLPPQYQLPSSTDLSIRVAEGTNQIPVLNLHR